ncbi:Carbohydrate binding domain-containing protein [Phyllobacterium sp. YR620]|uniref:right-handed parallel beta-helix repeat-containing protein n=1 Tax=Phyllobacterium sp. YR620 TaxID=1881066 RepID=UPI00088C31C2|nr:right-handed parallel beta-helix repeat-containing protein [Phyllobacterium sp. YR620]SDP92565.1 Carbohydrate binding domain-containing protein [Phyllobacterium sp. YR620]
MAIRPDYTAGTVTIAANGTVLTGVGTIWAAASIKPGATFKTKNLDAIIASVDSNTQITLTEPWTGGALAGATYAIRYQPDGSSLTAKVQELIEQLGNGNVLALSGLTGALDEVPVFTGPGAMTTIPRSELTRGVEFDVQVDTLADRAAYDGQAEGYKVLVSNVGDGRSALYSKASNTLGDWSDPSYITGPIGAVGPSGYNPRGSYSGSTSYVEGDVVLNNGSSWSALSATTGNAPPLLPATSNTWWQLVAQKGTDGTGIGDMLKSTYDPQNKQGDAFPYDTKAAAEAATISGGINTIRLLGYGSAGDGGGGLYVRVGSEPSHAGKLQSADGAWWQLSTDTAHPRMFNAPGNLTGDDSPAVQKALNYLKFIGRGALDLTGTFKIVDGVALSGMSNIEIVSKGGVIYYPQASANHYHLFRINSCANILVDGLNIYSDSALERDDTGFAVQVSGSFGVRITNNRFADIASACVWMDNSQDLIVTGNFIDSGKADGIHFSDGCRDFVCSDNTINSVEDDAIAVVRDTGGVIPSNGTISGNVIRQTIRGHGVVLISCHSIVVSGNNLEGFIGPAIACYTWVGTTDRAVDILITGNIIRNVGSAPETDLGSCAIALAGTQRAVVKSNDIQGPGVIDATHPNAAIFFIDDSADITIEGNALHDSAKYGVLVNDLSGTSNNGIRVLRNDFRNVAELSFKARPAGGLGKVVVSGNTFELCGYSNPNNRIIEIANAGANGVYVGGNKQIDARRSIFVDAATCSAIFAEDNTPTVKISYNPSARASDESAFTSATSQASYWRSSGMMFVRIIVTITTKGAGVGLKVDVPVVNDGGGHAFQWRETAVTGAVGTAEFADNNTLYLSPADAAQGDPVASGRTIEINGWYTTSG